MVCRIETEYGPISFDSDLYSEPPPPITVTADTIETVLKALYAALKWSVYERSCFSSRQVLLRTSAEQHADTLVRAFLRHGYNPAYIRSVLRQLGDTHDGSRLDYPITGRPRLKRRPDADFRITLEWPLYPTFQKWAEEETFPDPPSLTPMSIGTCWQERAPRTRPYLLKVSRRNFSRVIEILHDGLIDSRMTEDQCGPDDAAFRRDLVYVMDQLVASLLKAGYDPAQLIGPIFQKEDDPQGRRAGYWVTSVPWARRRLDDRWLFRVAYPAYRFLNEGWLYK